MALVSPRWEGSNWTSTPTSAPPPAAPADGAWTDLSTWKSGLSNCSQKKRRDSGYCNTTAQGNVVCVCVCVCVCTREREGGQYVNRVVPCSARTVRDGFRAEVAWQCIGAGERSQEMTTSEASQGRVECKESSRALTRPGDLRRHKSLRERSKTVQEQRGALQCVTCMRWFKSAGRLAKCA